jgi:ribosomal protein S18 acetylase RimI-like enzyme
MQVLIVRQAHPGELPLLIAESSRTAWEQLCPRQQPGSFAAAVQRTREMWSQALRQSGTVLVLAREGQAPPVGYILLAPQVSPFGGPTELVVLDIWVDPSARGQGAGRRLLGAAEEYARRLAFPGLVAQVAVHNRSSLELFTRAGYQVERVIAGKPVSAGTAP